MGTIDFQETLFQRSGRLFANPSFMSGFARALDLGATFNEYNRDNTPEEADYWALWSDWYSIGDDLSYAFYLLQQHDSVGLSK